MTASAAAALARRAASAADRPSARAARKTPACASPARSCRPRARPGRGCERLRAAGVRRCPLGCGRSGFVGVAGAGCQQASVRPERGRGRRRGRCGRAAERRLVGGDAGEQGGLAGVAAEPVAPGEHRLEHLRGDLRDERSRVDEQQHGRRQRRRPAAEPGPRAGRDQAVAGHVDGVAGAGRDRVPASRLGRRLRAEAGDERPLGVRFDQRHVEAGVADGSGGRSRPMPSAARAARTRSPQWPVP